MSSKIRVLVQVALLVALMFLFFLSLELMGSSFKLMGRGFAETLLAQTANPFVGLFVGIFATTLVQSSSTTTTMVVSLVAGGALTIEGAVPIIMGANIGTSVTNTMVSFAQVTRPAEFRRAFAGATIHDFFNWMTVLVLLPLELAFGMLAKGASFLARTLEGVGGADVLSPVKAVTQPVASAVTDILGNSGVLVLIASILLLFFALKFLVDLLKTALSSGAERWIHATLFRSPPVAIGAGAVMTAAVQSSSITTSTMVPLVGAGVVTLEQVFPFTVGANLGTTVTAMLAALQIGSKAAVTVAFSHLLFNISGMLLIYAPPPVRKIPLAMARYMGDLASRRRSVAVAYLVGMFYALPLLFLFVSGVLRPDPDATVPAPVDRETSAEQPIATEPTPAQE